MLAQAQATLHLVSQAISTFLTSNKSEMPTALPLRFLQPGLPSGRSQRGEMGVGGGNGRVWICWHGGSPTPSRMLRLLHLPLCSQSLLLPETSRPSKAAGQLDS